MAYQAQITVSLRPATTYSALAVLQGLDEECVLKSRVLEAVEPPAERKVSGSHLRKLSGNGSKQSPQLGGDVVGAALPRA